MQKYWQQTMAVAQTWRHELHANPELGWQEQETAERIRKNLSELNISWRPCADTGTVAILNPQAKGDAQHIALRGDIDALPIDERTDVDWKSTKSGCMHACGHDGHTATLLATARWLKHVESDLPGPVSLLFQPAEEGGHGAKRMIEDGALEGVDCIYGWHNWPAIPFGQILCPNGIVMCGNGTFDISLTGIGGHASQPEICRDPVLAASAITLALQQVVSRRLPPQEASVLSVTSIEAPSASTVIPEKAVLGGSIRISSEKSRERINQLIEDISQHTAQSYGVDCEVAIHPRYQPTINHPEQAEQMRQHWRSLYGHESLSTQHPVPVMASEDFSYYLKEIPGAYALIGADDGNNHHHPCHSPYYDFNDRLVERVTRLYAQLVGAPLP